MPIRTTCPTCSKTFSLSDDMAGKRVKCPCGATMAVGSGSAQTNAPAAQTTARVAVPQAAKPVAATAAARPVAATAVAPAAKRATPPPQPAPNRSIFDELTENDFNRPQYQVPTAATVDTKKDAKFLNRFAGPDEEAAKADAESKGWFIFLGVVHILWAMIYCGLAVLLVVASAALTMVEESMPILRLGLATFIAIASFFAVWTGATGIGIMTYKPWGWWLGVYSMFWGIFDRLSTLAFSIMNPPDEGSYRVGHYIGFGIGILGCIAFLNMFCTVRNRKAFGVKTPVGIALLICGLTAFFIIGGISLMIHYIPLDDEVPT